MATHAPQAGLFDARGALPEGFVYRSEFITPEEESALLEILRGLPFREAQYREFTARRRTVSYGGKYDFTRKKLDPVEPIPEFLMPLREKVARWANLPAQSFVHGLINEYQPGTPLGWHRDAPDFGVVAGVSLGGDARMRLRPYRPGEKHRREDVIPLDLEPRSAYVMRGTARWGWQHCVSPTKALRYSITFRTARNA